LKKEKKDEEKAKHLKILKTSYNCSA